MDTDNRSYLEAMLLKRAGKCSRHFERRGHVTSLQDGEEVALEQDAIKPQCWAPGKVEHMSCP